MTSFDEITTAELISINENSVSLKASTTHNNLVMIEIGFVYSDTVRFRLFKEKKNESFLLTRLPEEHCQVQITLLDQRIDLRTEALHCQVDLWPLRWKICTLAGEEIWSEQRNDTNVRGSSNVPTLGVWQDSRRIEKVCDSFVLEPDDKLFGFGEKFFAHDKRGHTIINWNLDAYGVETERAYKNIPFCLCSNGYGVLVNSFGRIEHSVGDPSRSRASYVLTVEDEQLDYFVFWGPSFKHILKRLTDLTGNAPVPPEWAFGLWMSRCYFHNRAAAEEVANKLRDLDIPCDVIVFDGYWVRDAHQCDFIWDEERFQNPRQMLLNLKAKGFKSCVWEGPFVPSGTEMLEEGERGNFLLVNPEGKTFLINTGLVMASHNQENFRGQETAGSFDGLPPSPPAALVDFTNPEAVQWYQQKHRDLLDLGVDVFKTDFGEQVPEDARSPYSGLTGKKLHNLYTVLYNQAVFNITKEFKGRGLVWARSAGIGSQQFPVHWGGDPQTSFSSLAGCLRGGLSVGLSGIPFWGSDIGGFFGQKPSLNLYIRWAQFGLLSGLARCHGTTPREPWEYGDEAVEIFRKYTKLRYNLIPYLYTYAYIASQSGLPLMRPLVLEFQDDPTAQLIDSQYLLGDWILVAPIMSNNNRRMIYLPKGKWLDYWTREIYNGPQYLDYLASLDVLPLFIRQGALIPLAPDISFVGEKKIDPITLLVYPDRVSSLEFQDDDERINLSCRTYKDCVVIEVGHSQKTYQIQIVGVERPVKVEAENTEIPFFEDLQQSKSGWSWNRQDGLLIKCPPAPFCVTIHSSKEITL